MKLPPDKSKPRPRVNKPKAAGSALQRTYRTAYVPLGFDYLRDPLRQALDLDPTLAHKKADLLADSYVQLGVPRMTAAQRATTVFARGQDPAPLSRSVATCMRAATGVPINFVISPDQLDQWTQQRAELGGVLLTAERVKTCAQDGQLLIGALEWELTTRTLGWLEARLKVAPRLERDRLISAAGPFLLEIDGMRAGIRARRAQAEADREALRKAAEEQRTEVKHAQTLDAARAGQPVEPQDLFAAVEAQKDEARRAKKDAAAALANRVASSRKTPR